MKAKNLLLKKLIHEAKLSNSLYCSCGYSFEEPYKLDLGSRKADIFCANVIEPVLLELIDSALQGDGRLERKIKIFKEDGKRQDEEWEDFDLWNYSAGIGIAVMQFELKLKRKSRGFAIASFNYSLKELDFPDSQKLSPYGYEKRGEPNKLIEDLKELSRKLEEKLKDGS